MFKFRTIAILVVFYLLLPRAIATTPELQTNTTGDAERERGEEISGEFETRYFGIEKLKDWSYYNYSSNEWHARDSLVRNGDKIYDPLSFKGAENDTYGTKVNFFSKMSRC
jgi:hypothetical protein